MDRTDFEKNGRRQGNLDKQCRLMYANVSVDCSAGSTKVILLTAIKLRHIISLCEG